MTAVLAVMSGVVLAFVAGLAVVAAAMRIADAMHRRKRA